MKTQVFFIKQHIYHTIHHHRKQFLGVGILIGFLLFLLNIFIGISSYTHSFSENLGNKLGMYFYIKETPETQSSIYKKIIDLQNTLQKEGLKVMFSSKEDAMKFLEQKLPNINENFSKFGIENPLPATLYVMFSSYKQYNFLKTTLLEYKDIILNIKDISDGKTIQEQENRILNIINMNTFVLVFSLFLVVFLIIVILSFLGYQTYFLFSSFKKDIEIKSILGASFLSIIKEFIIINISTLLLGFFLSFILLILAWSIIGVSLYEMFSIGLLEIFSQSSIFYVFGGFFVEFILFSLFTFFLSYFIIYRLHK